LNEPANTVTIHGTFDAPDPTTPWKLTLFSNDIGIWPEKSLPQFAFTGTAFTITFPWEHQTVFLATVSSALPSDWSTSEYSDPVSIGER
jgi:hypothetical protein